jgi:hypothetical protein
MFKTRSLYLLLILFSILNVTATGQEPLPQEQIRQVNKVRKKLTHFDAGTKLDVRLNNGSHHIGTLSETGSATFVLIDPASGKLEAIDYLDVKRVQPTRKEFAAQQLSKTENSLPKVGGIALLIVAAILVIGVAVK